MRSDKGPWKDPNILQVPVKQDLCLSYLTSAGKPEQFSFPITKMLDVTGFSASFCADTPERESRGVQSNRNLFDLWRKGPFMHQLKKFTLLPSYLSHSLL